MLPPVIALTDVELTLRGNAGPVEILRGVTLSVHRGETLGLVGPSGSGKSSLLMLMGGLESATGGTVRALGQDLTRMGEDALARFRRDHMGVVFQSFHLIPTMTALENVATPLELAGDLDAFDKAAEELRAVGLGPRMTITRRSSRGASSSGWRWRGPSRRGPRSCWRTSPRATSTARRGRRSWSCCSGCGTALARRW
jgi:predicted ABC-type transport system involved in lysophospholipase L1 biosynthesis ATPase subunit